MPKGIAAGELVKKAGGAKGTEFAKNGVKKAAKHKAVDKAVQKGIDATAEKAIGAVFTFATGGAAVALKRRRDKSKARRDAIDLARQVGGTYSLNVLIGSERYHVVWLADDSPYRVIPDLPTEAGPVAEQPDLKLFRGKRDAPKPQKS